MWPAYYQAGPWLLNCHTACKIATNRFQPAGCHLQSKHMLNLFLLLSPLRGNTHLPVGGGLQQRVQRQEHILHHQRCTWGNNPWLAT